MPTLQELYTAHNGNIRAAARAQGIPYKTLYDAMKGIGLQGTGKKDGGKRLTVEEINVIVSMYDFSNGNAYVASRYCSCSPTTVTKYWRLAGLEVRTSGPRTGKDGWKKSLSIDQFVSDD